MTSRVSRFAALLAAAAVGTLAAQTAAPVTPTTMGTHPAPSTSDVTATGDEELVKLSPFEVATSRDTGYQATETLAGTRIRTDLGDIAGGISVVTKEFMRDIGATDIGSLLQYTTNTEVAGTLSTYSGLGNGTSVDETGNLRAPAGAQRVRGLSAADNTRDFFVTDIPTDYYNVDRVDIQRGANSFLFGLGSPAGIINASLRNAEFRNLGSVEARTGSYGSLRTALDVNEQIIPKTLAIRVDGLWDATKYEQTQAFQNQKRLSGALRYDPQLFKNPAFHTSVRMKYENGDIKADRPRTTPPNNAITQWWAPVAVSASNPFGGLGKLLINNGYDAFRSDTANIVPGDGKGVQQISTVNYNAWVIAPVNQQQDFWLIDGATGQTQRIMGGYINPGARNADGTVRGASLGILGKRYADQMFGVGGLANYANNARLPGYQYGQYRQQSLLDPTVFDFYHNLIDGPSASQFEHWNAGNIDLQQTGWNDRVGIELAFDHQKYMRGGDNFLSNPTLSIDLLQNYQDLSANPNVGRPYVTGNGGGNSYRSDRKFTRAALFGELRPSDLTSNDFLLQLFGRQRLNGSYSAENYYTENRSWMNYANSTAWAGYWNGTNGTTDALNDRPPVGFVYLGSSVANRSAAAGAHIPGIGSNITLPNGNVYAFDSTWNAASTVAYGAPWTIPANLAVAYDPASATTQASNPANYVGWNNNFNMNLLANNSLGQNDNLLTSASQSLRKSTSYAGSWQSYLWRDAFVLTYGWRFDNVAGKDITAAGVTANRSILNLSPDVYALPTNFPAGQIFKGHSTSGGIVGHLNRILKHDFLPINVSLSYNESNNFQIAGTRRDLYGNPIGNPDGKTRDYGLVLSTKDDRFSFRAIKYDSLVISATSSLSGAGGLGSIIQQGLRWRNVFKYQLGGYTPDTANQPQDRNNWQPDPTLGETQAMADARKNASIAAWDAIQAKLAPTGFFQAWGFDPTQVYAYVATAPQGFAVTADTESKGYELELTANPLRNWRLALNASETTAVNSNLGGPVLDDYVNYITAQMAGPAGQMRQFSGGPTASTTLQMWNGFLSGYTLLKLQQGAAAPEIRKWRYGFQTNYTFTSNFLKGVGVGGGYRWQDKVTIGYPVVAIDASTHTFDLTKPYHGPAEGYADLWASYGHKVNQRINWRLQINVRNVGVKDHLIPTSVEPDGVTWAAARTSPVQEWFMTNTFSF